jgi:hypothetical protein
MKKYFIILLSLLVFTSCKKWLDVKPESEASRDELFKTQEGFIEALNGVYSRCVTEESYGFELTAGLAEVMAQDYTINPVDDAKSLRYYEATKYNYKDQYIEPRKNKIWKSLYSAIVNANLILENIDQKKAIFRDNNYAIIKGEALALRGYLHFDAFRLFGTSFSSTGTATGIPYVTAYSNKVTPMSSPDEVVRKVLEDLNAAKQLLLPADSIRSSSYIVGYPYVYAPGTTQLADKNTETASRSLFQQNRRHRLNYYAVCGELARVYLYKGDKANALLNAEEVINSKKFPWTATADITTIDVKKVDRINYKELVFGWYAKGEEEEKKLSGTFGDPVSGLGIDLPTAQALYEVNTGGGIGGEDLRYKYWIQMVSGSLTKLLKYKRNEDAREDDNSANPYPQIIPGIRLTEMYYIAAESNYDINPAKATAYLDEVRGRRGIIVKLNVTSKNEFMNELVKEARKEWLGEGQIFFMYKRLNRSIAGPSGSLISPSDKIFVLPLPNDEIEFGGR